MENVEIAVMEMVVHGMEMVMMMMMMMIGFQLVMGVEIPMTSWIQEEITTGVITVNVILIATGMRSN
tara:strand:- start:15193 stop:15393 length:201 start_codon:yes stop_codon:yes gene_type:complete